MTFNAEASEEAIQQKVLMVRRLQCTRDKSKFDLKQLRTRRVEDTLTYKDASEKLRICISRLEAVDKPLVAPFLVRCADKSEKAKNEIATYKNQSLDAITAQQLVLDMTDLSITQNETLICNARAEIIAKQKERLQARNKLSELQLRLKSNIQGVYRLYQKDMASINSEKLCVLQGSSEHVRAAHTIVVCRSELSRVSSKALAKIKSKISLKETNTRRLTDELRSSRTELRTMRLKHDESVENLENMQLVAPSVSEYVVDRVGGGEAAACGDSIFSDLDLSSDAFSALLPDSWASSLSLDPVEPLKTLKHVASAEPAALLTLTCGDTHAEDDTLTCGDTHAEDATLTCGDTQAEATLHERDANANVLVVKSPAAKRLSRRKNAANTPRKKHKTRK